jgi:hypothetical protein
MSDQGKTSPKEVPFDPKEIHNEDFQFVLKIKLGGTS